MSLLQHLLVQLEPHRQRDTTDLVLDSHLEHRIGAGHIADSQEPGRSDHHRRVAGRPPVAVFVVDSHSQLQELRHIHLLVEVVVGLQEERYWHLCQTQRLDQRMRASSLLQRVQEPMLPGHNLSHLVVLALDSPPGGSLEELTWSGQLVR